MSRVQAQTEGSKPRRLLARFSPVVVLTSSVLALANTVSQAYSDCGLDFEWYPNRSNGYTCIQGAGSDNSFRIGSPTGPYCDAFSPTEWDNVSGNPCCDYQKKKRHRFAVWDCNGGGWDCEMLECETSPATTCGSGGSAVCH